MHRWLEFTGVCARVAVVDLKSSFMQTGVCEATSGRRGGSGNAGADERMHKEVAPMQRCVWLYLHGHSDRLPAGCPSRGRSSEEGRTGIPRGRPASLFLTCIVFLFLLLFFFFLRYDQSVMQRSGRRLRGAGSHP